MNSIDKELQEVQSKIDATNVKLKMLERRVQSLRLEKERIRSEAKENESLKLFNEAFRQHWREWTDKKDWIKKEAEDLTGFHIPRTSRMAKLLEENFGRFFCFKRECDFDGCDYLYVSPRFHFQESELIYLPEI